MTTQSKGYVARLTITLFAITLVVAALLGLVNAVTAEPIAQAAAERTAAAMASVLTFDTYEEVAFTDETGLVQTVWQASADGAVCGFVAEVTPSGFGGAISMIVGIGTDGTVTGISITDHDETSGLGAVAAADTTAGETFRAQFAGASGALAVTKDGGTIDALTGATITSRAVVDGVNAALAAVAPLIPLG